MVIRMPRLGDVFSDVATAVGTSSSLSLLLSDVSLGAGRLRGESSLLCCWSLG